MLPAQDFLKLPPHAVRFEWHLSLACLSITLVATILLFILDLGPPVVDALWIGETILALEIGCFAILALVVLYGGTAHQVARIGCLARVRELTHVSTVQARHPHPPGVTVLVPSYKEEVAVIRRTLLSAALQAHPDLSVLLLIDDPPQPRDPGDRAALERARGLVPEVVVSLSGPADVCHSALALISSSDLDERKRVLLRLHEMRGTGSRP